MPELTVIFDPINTSINILLNLSLRILQKVNDLPISGMLNEATLTVMRKPRCGIEDSFNNRSLRYSMMGGYSHCTLSFKEVVVNQGSRWSTAKWWRVGGPVRLKDLQYKRLYY